MRLLSTFFPRRPRPRTVVHAGPLLLRRRGAERSLRRYLRLPRKREVFLVHHGHEVLRETAKEAGVTDIAVDASEKQEANAATEMALALGARRLDFTIDEPGVSAPDGTALREVTVRAAESLARSPSVRPRIRAKLRAGCAALRKGMARVRIGDPAALTRNQATILRPDPNRPVSADPRSPWKAETAEDSAGERVAIPQPPPVSAHAEARAAPPPAPGGRHRVVTPVEEPFDSLNDPWWRLRARPAAGSSRSPFAA